MRPFTCGAALAVAMLAAPPGEAMDKVACAAAAVSGQKLSRDRKLVQASEQLEACATDGCPDVMANDCKRWLADVRARLPTLDLTARGSGGIVPPAVVEIDGRTVALPASAVGVDPGAHTLTFRAAGYVPQSQRVDLAEGAHPRVDVTLVPMALSPVASIAVERRGSPRTPWLVTSIATSTLAVAGFALFAGFGAAGASDQSAFRASCAPLCTQAQVDQVAGEFTWANVGLVTGLVALAATAVTWFITVRTHR